MSKSIISGIHGAVKERNRYFVMHELIGFVFFNNPGIVRNMFDNQSRRLNKTRQYALHYRCHGKLEFARLKSELQPGRCHYCTFYCRKFTNQIVKYNTSAKTMAVNEYGDPRECIPSALYKNSYHFICNLSLIHISEPTRPY